MSDIHPIYSKMLSREDREAKLKQRAKVIWLSGLSGSGKSTLTTALERRLFDEGFVTTLLDGDNVRDGLNRGLGFTDTDREENNRRVAEVSKLFLQSGIICLKLVHHAQGIVPQAGARHHRRGKPAGNLRRVLVRDLQEA